MSVVFSTFDSISISNPKWNVWVGEVFVKKDEIRRKVICTNCGDGNMGQMVNGKLSVDGNGDGKGRGAWCLDGKVCVLKLIGKDYILSTLYFWMFKDIKEYGSIISSQTF